MARHQDSAYWVATQVGAEPPQLKTYFDLPGHEEDFATALADIAECYPAVEIETEGTLRNLVHHPAVMRAGRLRALQGRLASRGSFGRNVVEVKGYLSPRFPGSLGARMLMQSLRAALPKGAADDLNHLPALVSETADRFPLFYISVAYRPHLEIELYHDEETAVLGSTSEEVLDRASIAFGDHCWLDIMAKAVPICVDAGMRCTHISQDVYPAKDARVSLFFEAPAGDDRRETIHSTLELLCDRFELPRHPFEIFEAGSLSPARDPFGIGLSGFRDGHGGLRITHDEARRDVIDRI